MARRAQITDETDPIDAEFVDRTDITATLDAEEEDIAQEFGGATADIKMHFIVKKRVPDSRMLSHCFLGKHSDLPVLPRIQAQFGAGIYEVWVFKNGQLSAKHTLSVEVPLHPQIQQAASDPALAEMVRQQGALLQRLTENPQAKPSISPADWPALITAGAAAITALKPLFAPPPTNSLGDMLGLLATAKELFGEGGKSEPDSVFGLLSNVINNPGIAEAIASLSRGAQTAQVAPQPVPAQIGYTPQQPVQTPNPNPPQAPDAQTQQIIILQKEMTRLTARAVKGSDPALWADVLIDTYEPQFLQMLMQEGALDFLCQVYPPASAHRPWFERLLEEIAGGLDGGAETGADIPNTVNSSLQDAKPSVSIVFPNQAPASNASGNSAGTSGGFSDFDGDGGEGSGGEG